jgi:hypothetical protein
MRLACTTRAVVLIAAVVESKSRSSNQVDGIRSTALTTSE